MWGFITGPWFLTSVEGSHWEPEPHSHHISSIFYYIVSLYVRVIVFERQRVNMWDMGCSGRRGRRRKGERSLSRIHGQHWAHCRSPSKTLRLWPEPKSRSQAVHSSASASRLKKPVWITGSRSHYTFQVADNTQKEMNSLVGITGRFFAGRFQAPLLQH